MDWQAVIKEYEGFLKLEKGLSSNSIEAYLSDIGKLEQFLELVQIEATPEELDRELLGNFLSWITEMGLPSEFLSRVYLYPPSKAKFLLIR